MSSSLISSSSSDAAASLGPLAPMGDVVCGVDFVVGTAEMTVRDCLQLARHSVVRLSQAAGADVDVRVNGVSVAFGEVAVIDDSAALRITRFSMPSGVGWE